MEIKHEFFGKLKDNREVYRYIISNDNGITIKIINYGGIIQSIEMPDKNGQMEDIVLGFDNLDAYLGDHPYFGALIGRYANRIANAHFIIGDVDYKLTKNEGEKCLHGGKNGFDKVLWSAEEFQHDQETGLILDYFSPHLENGFPGNLRVKVVYTLTNENELKIDYEAETDKSTHVNFTQHSYFNLTACKSDVLNHMLYVKADEITETDEESIPTGNFIKVKDTAYDFNAIKPIKEDFHNTTNGYDDNFVLNKPKNQLESVAKLIEPDSKRSIEVFTTEPGLQIYTGNYLDNIKGKKGIPYQKNYGVCLETQHYPDSPNHPHFPSTLVEQGKKFTSRTVYKFGLID